jgi:predicted nucleic acid-binding protein
MAGRLVVFDTSIFIDHLRTNRHERRIGAVTGLVRNSSVVLSELLRGATNREERDFVSALARNHPILTPTEGHWLESGRLLARMHEAEGLPPGKLRDLHFDVLIALTARHHGATVITSDRADFARVRKYRLFDLEIW